MASYKTIYARIIPTNGVANEKFSVSVSGVAATVDAPKIWTSGALNFAITPNASGRMIVNFKNDTLNQIIGSREIGIGSDTYAKGTIFEVGTWQQTSTLKHLGYGQNSTTNFGKEIVDNLTFENKFVGLGYCSFIGNLDGSNTVGGINITITNDTAIGSTDTFRLRFTNLTNNISLTPTVFTYSYMSLPGSTTWDVMLDAAQTALARQIFVAGQQVGVEMIEDTAIEVVTTAFKSETYASNNYNIMWGVNAYDYFISKVGRAPFAGERVTLNVSGTTSLIAPNLSVGALQFDERWSNVGLVTVQNRGILLGRGGNHLGHYSNGGPAIVNLSTNNIRVENHNIIAGGGGGGASFSGTWNNVDGGYGAPFGGTTTDLSFTYAQPARIGGAGYSGPGGGWGQPGKHNSDNDYRNWSNPGKILTGPGTVNNIGSGITLGLQ